MPRLVITSSGRWLLLAVVILSAATLGSARPMELPGRHVVFPEVPELVIPHWYSAMYRSPCSQGEHHV
ncbi:hypothetical protein FWJ25_13625 [Marinobacter salinexigens]|uniref:Uncharacterized protein n=1 Tax=Marinobacter salinexigens TaxID=2919747 RepID=A0A5B0VEJ6_9GAMM|nr:hypothetical protein [Marinobacter salinexigens]KAA1172844.1 hypothetical protein FWJ25_13625 [Marinobacter salinexigens]